MTVGPAVLWHLKQVETAAADPPSVGRGESFRLRLARNCTWPRTAHWASWPGRHGLFADHDAEAADASPDRLEVARVGLEGKLLTALPLPTLTAAVMGLALMGLALDVLGLLAFQRRVNSPRSRRRIPGPVFQAGFLLGPPLSGVLSFIALQVVPWLVVLLGRDPVELAASR